MSADVDTVRAPALTTVGGRVAVAGSGSLTALLLPSLLSVGGDLIVGDNTALTNLSAPLLATIGGAVDISRNTVQAELALPALTTIGERLFVRTNPALTSVSLGALATVGGLVDVGAGHRELRLNLDTQHDRTPTQRERGILTGYPQFIHKLEPAPLENGLRPIARSRLGPPAPVKRWNSVK